MALAAVDRRPAPSAVTPSRKAVLTPYCIHQDRTLRDAVLEGLSDLRQRDLGLGLKRDILRHSRFRPPCRIIGPLLGQIETIRDGKARMTVRDRQRNGNLAIILLAELAAILPRHANRVLTLLRKACVINDKGFDRAVLFEYWQRPLPNLSDQDALPTKCKSD
jgi:hypothetical protein